MTPSSVQYSTLRNFAGRSLAAAALALTLLLPAPGAGNQAMAAELDRAEVEKIVREYLLANPEIMLEVQQALEQKQEEMRLAQQKDTLQERAGTIFNSKHQMVIGDPDAPITVVEFFDYNCGFCRRALADMERILEENKDVKFILKEFPVLGEASLAAHRVSLSVARNFPDIYAEFHRQLLSHEGRKDGDVALEIAQFLGADRKKLVDDLANPDTMAAFSEIYSIADGLGITGTPSYVIGDDVVFGAVGYDRLMPLIEEQTGEGG
ncbi:DsbA family protein [Salaquimonas pukyongi]|uniref:DsbA family protein n=1 Tax=Salaquimonas pukyongi TaxID=2712698 RepID=UPI00096B7DD5|nr:DsbA family protein [Salaquimonas pukyongi]